ncbi:hypothetical protein DVH24_038839 [Malus domestica]|uniref:Uncharacterized protein n=1 Tax=Malus domestica TaxID=3750 RepID=A0A498KFM6_MALDO|nr:hypothetical protein DVH24_038839 [Malus domestica]
MSLRINKDVGKSQEMVIFSGLNLFTFFFHYTTPYGFITFQVSASTTRFGVQVDFSGRDVSVWYQNHSTVWCEYADEDVWPLRRNSKVKQVWARAIPG